LGKKFGLSLSDEELLASVYEKIYVHKCDAKMACQEVANLNEIPLSQVESLFQSHEALKLC